MDGLLWDLRALIWIGSALILACGTYIVWPSRWNVPAHMAVAFLIVAQVVPVAMLGSLDSQPRTLVVALLKVHALGALFFVLGIALGGTRPHRERAQQRWRQMLSVDESRGVARRAGWGLSGGILALVLAIVVMGFIPMFATDPLSAKFFRGSYGEAYAPVAPLYRAGTAMITLLIPAAAIYAATRRRLGWAAGVIASLAVMVVTLQRGPAFSGILLALGVIMAARRRTGMYFVVLVASYVAGTLFYFLLGALGVESFEGNQLTSGSILATISATAPDVQDEFWFFSRWLAAGEPLTYGRTFFGGLVPGNNPWNPGVWTLTLGDPSIDVKTLASGGLRLPLPMWGLVSFGVVGVAMVSLLSGIFAGYFARLANYVIVAASDDVARVWLLTLYGTITAIFVSFYTLSYLDLVQLVALTWILRDALGRGAPQDLAQGIGPIQRPDTSSRGNRRETIT